MLVLVTGAAGRIGSHLTRLLLKRGHTVRAFVLPGDPRAQLIDGPGVEILPGRLQDPGDLAAAVRGVDAVYHLAGALTSRGNSDEEFFELNLRGTFSLLQAVRQHAPSVRRFAYASSDAVYWSGDVAGANYLPIDEAHPRVAGTIYGASKIGAEELCFTFWRGYGIPVTILRFGATGDPSELIDPDGVFGRTFFLRGMIRFLASRPNLAPKQSEDLAILRDLDDGSEKLVVQANRDGEPIVAQIGDARDIADGCARVLDTPAAVGEAFNLGPPAPYAADQLVGYLAERLGLATVTARLPTARKPWYTSSAKARGILGYEPKRTVFAMIDEALADG